MHRSRFLAISIVVALSACGDPVVPRQSDVGYGTGVEPGTTLSGVLERSTLEWDGNGGAPSRLTLRQPDRVVLLAGMVSHATYLVHLIGSEVVVTGEFIGPSEFRVASIQPASPEAAFSRRPGG